MTANPHLLVELQSRLDPACIQSDTDVITAYAQDRAVFEGAGSAAVLVMPRSTAEVVATVEAANSAGVPIVPRGAGTGLTGAANATDGCILLSLHRLNQILDIDAINSFFTSQLIPSSEITPRVPYGGRL